MRGLFLMICLAAALMMSGCVASDQQYQMLENRITAIEAENNRNAKQGKESPVEQLDTRLDEFSQTSRQNYAELRSEVMQLKEKIYSLEGGMEEIRHKIGTSDQASQDMLETRLDRLDNAITQNFERLIAVEEYMGFEPTIARADDTVAQSDDKSREDYILPMPVNSEQAAYEKAKQTLDQGDREGARLLFENFINKYPESQNAANARFWIADSYYAEKWYEKAILEYQKVLEDYPDSQKLAPARLKQGYAFAELGENANARLILKELIKRHPDTNEAKFAAEKLNSLQ